jgi:hypothetical protein
VECFFGRVLSHWHIVSGIYRWDHANFDLDFANMCLLTNERMKGNQLVEKNVPVALLMRFKNSSFFSAWFLTFWCCEEKLIHKRMLKNAYMYTKKKKKKKEGRHTCAKEKPLLEASIAEEAIVL